MDKIVYIITGDNYPNGDAGAIRSHSFAKLFQSSGYRPIVIGMGKMTNFKMEKYDDVDYYSLRYSFHNLIFKILGRVLFSLNVKRIINKSEMNKVYGIMFVSGGKSILDYIKSLSKKYNIKLFYDAVEWFSPSEFKDGKNNSLYKYNEQLNSIYIDNSFNVISISKYFETYFKEKNINTIRIPVIMDVNKINYNKNTNEEFIKIVYAGQMGGKDKISYFISALNLLSPEDLNKLRMYIIGVTLEDYEKEYGEISSKLKNHSLFFTGRISRDEVLQHLIESDFTLLLRPEDERYAKAGFPTKVVESLSSGTPVICNYTSDLSLYLKDNYDSIIVKNFSVEACYEALKKALSKNNQERISMQKNARKTAEENFNWINYIANFKKFIN